MPDHSERIAEIDEILRAGATSVSNDGTTVNYDFEQLRRERRQLLAADTTHRGRRPAIAQVNLSGF